MNGLIGSCRKGKLSVVWLKRYVANCATYVCAPGFVQLAMATGLYMRFPCKAPAMKKLGQVAPGGPTSTAICKLGHKNVFAAKVNTVMAGGESRTLAGYGSSGAHRNSH